LFIRRGLNWFSDKLSGGGASTAELQAQRDKNCADLNGTARYRVPDGLADTTITEVKNRASVSYTAQIRDYVEYAKRKGLVFELWTRPDSHLSGPLKQAIDSGDIIWRQLP
jgi:hypothetical protein